MIFTEFPPHIAIFFYGHTQAEYCSRVNRESIRGKHSRSLEQTCSKMENSCGIVGNNKLIEPVESWFMTTQGMRQLSSRLWLS